MPENRPGTARERLLAAALDLFAEHGVSGVLVDERDDKALAKAIISAALHPERLSEMGSAGAKQVANKFEQAKQTRRLEEIYLRAIA